MIFAHLPSGYVLAQFTKKHWSTKACFWAACLGSVFPDIDLFYYWIIASSHGSHHDYFTHLPFFWALVSVIAICFHCPNVVKSFLAAIWIHLILDSFIGAIAWLYPFTNRKFALFSFHPTHSYWLWNQILSWTFAFEVLIMACAAVLYMKSDAPKLTRYVPLLRIRRIRVRTHVSEEVPSILTNIESDLPAAESFDEQN